MTPAPGQIYARGREIRTITRVVDGYVQADCKGGQRDHVICNQKQWEKWAVGATCTRFDELEGGRNA